MQTLHPNLGFASQTSLHAAHSSPATPPYTPAKHKRPFSRADSPASSIHPTETSSPAKKVLKRTASDNVLVVELPDNDINSLPDIDVVSPSELEEAEDYLSEIHSDIVDAEPTYVSDPESDSDSDTGSGISSRFSRLNCDEQEEQEEMTQKRLERRLSKRVSIRVFKRPHSQSADGDTRSTDTTDDVDERNGDASIRRLRRRMLSPVGGPIDWDEDSRSSPEPGVLASAKQGSSQDRKVQRTYASVLRGDYDDFAVEG